MDNLQRESLVVVPRTTDREAVRTLSGPPSDLLESMSAADLRRHVKALQSFSTSVLSHLHLEPVLQEVVRSLREMLEADTASVSLAEHPGGDLVTQMSSGFGSMSSPEDVIRLGEGIAGTVGLRGEAVAVDRVDEVEARARIRGLSSMMIAPLLHADGLIGLLEVGSRKPRIFTDAELYLLQVIAERAARAIENARTHDHTHERLLEEERIEQALAESEARYRLLVETAADAIVTIDAHTTIVTANPAAGSVFGFSVEELVGKSVEDIIPERYRAIYGMLLRRYLETGESRLPWRAIELTGLHRDGREILLEASFAEQVSGGRRLLTGTIRDITHRKRAERVLAAEHATSRVLAETRDVLEAIPKLLKGIAEALDWDAAGFWAWEADVGALAPIDYWTREPELQPELRRASANLLLRAGDGLPGKVWTDRSALWIEDLSAAGAFQRLAPLVQLGIRSAFALPVCVGDDCIGVMEFFSTHPATQDDMLLRAMDSLGSDIGQFIRRREAEIRAEDHEELQRYFSQVSSRLSALALDYDQTIETLAAFAVPRLADWCAVDIIGADGSISRTGIAHADPAMAETALRLSDLPLPDDPESPSVRVMETGQPFLIPTLDEDRVIQSGRTEEEREILRSLGLISLIIVPLTARNRILGSISFVATVGRRRYHEGDLGHAVEFARRAGNAVDNASLYRQMAEANRVKAEFLATISHELRTPLNAIVGYADLLGMGVLTDAPERGANYVGRISIAARHLAELIEEVLAFSRLESGREVVSAVRTELGDLLDEIRVIAEPLAQEKAIELEVRTPAEPVEVVTDARKLRQILLNVVGNAIKFTSEGGVKVESVVEEGAFVITVMDTGIGIERENLDRIFEPFWQVEQGTTRSVGGTGLGLTVTRRFIDLLGGSMEIDSEAGRGTTIRIRLPLKPA